MIRRPPRSTRTDTLFPYTTLFRSALAVLGRSRDQQEDAQHVLGQRPADRESLGRSEEHTSELQSLMRISYAVFCLKTKIPRTNNNYPNDPKPKRKSHTKLNHNTSNIIQSAISYTPTSKLKCS